MYFLLVVELFVEFEQALLVEFEENHESDWQKQADDSKHKWQYVFFAKALNVNDKRRGDVEHVEQCQSESPFEQERFGMSQQRWFGLVVIVLGMGEEQNSSNDWRDEHNENHEIAVG
jgi:hypothetical protein